MTHQQWFKPGYLPGFLLLLAACNAEPPAAPVAAAVSKPAVNAAPPVMTYADWLGSYDAALSAKDPPKAPASPEERLQLLLERARLSGDYGDYARAGEVIAAATAVQSLEPFPCLLIARWQFSLHRLAAAEQALAACKRPPDPVEAAGLKADLDFYRGHYRQAEAAYRAQLNAQDTSPAYVRLAQLRAKTGAPAEALALLEAAEQRYHGDSGVMRAWLKLQRGLIYLDRGQLELARALYLAAQEALPGWWLVDEHLAEISALLGERDSAHAAYQDIVQGTGAPEFIDALAALESEAGHSKQAAALLAQAKALYEQRLAQFPEAAAGHALEHFLNNSPDLPAVLTMARDNHRNRPYGEASIALARALILNRRDREAASLLQAESRAGWDTAELHWVLATALSRSGQPQAATAARLRALVANPQAEKMYIVRLPG